MPGQSELKIGVIGTGVMGRNHARILSDLPGAKLIGVADQNEATAGRVAHQYHCEAHTDYRALLDSGIDAVSIAVPTVRHLEIARAAVQRGINVLVEKPIASSIREGAMLAELAGESGVKLMVGHIERFNPAVSALKEMLDGGEIGRVFQIEARRQGPFPARIMDVGVTIDLAVHDVDIVRHVTGAEVEHVFAEMASRVRGTHEDSLYGLVRLDDGVMANLSINWLTPTKIRTLSVTGERGMFVVDYITQDLFFYENAQAARQTWDAMSLLRGVGEGRMIRHVVPRREPLRAELEAFVSCVLEDTPPPVTAADGLVALAIAEALLASADQTAVIPFQPVAGFVNLSEAA